jgi:hypothetical protein
MDESEMKGCRGLEQGKLRRGVEGDNQAGN